MLNLNAWSFITPATAARPLEFIQKELQLDFGKSYGDFKYK